MKKVEYSQGRARFWIYQNGDFARLALKPGESQEHSTHGYHDEGWSSEWQRWTHNGDHILLEWASDGRDCDGRLSRDGEAMCPLGNLKDRAAYGSDDPKIRLPEWQEVESGQRDYSAEAMNY
jgi:hypothetical protein